MSGKKQKVKPTALIVMCICYIGIGEALGAGLQSKGAQRLVLSPGNKP